jgi:enhancer of polycomb-like protein
VTSTDDTNPHLVFRPREKEKYKLRKKRQNDMEAYNKMRQLRSDFDNVRAILLLVKKREELNRLHLQMQVDLFQQRLHDVIDTSGQPRESKFLHRSNIKEVLEVPSFFDVHGRKSKRPRTAGSTTPRSAPTPIMTTVTAATLPDQEGEPRSIAGQNFGTPAPHFLQPLYSREDYKTSWQDTVPYVDTYVDAHAQVTFRYRHRTRVGRGGRVCIDRVPQIYNDDVNKKPPLTVFTAGKGLKPFAKPKARLLDLLPRPLDHLSLSRRVEELSVAGIVQDYEARMLPPSANGDPEDNDADEVIVRASEWKDTDGQLWGEERFIIGNDDEE